MTVGAGVALATAPLRPGGLRGARLMATAGNLPDRHSSCWAWRGGAADVLVGVLATVATGAAPLLRQSEAVRLAVRPQSPAAGRSTSPGSPCAARETERSRISGTCTTASSRSWSGGHEPRWPRPDDTDPAASEWPRRAAKAAIADCVAWPRLPPRRQCRGPGARRRPCCAVQAPFPVDVSVAPRLDPHRGRDLLRGVRGLTNAISA
ncbi:hypothetical protein QJS66_12485 [Kocuria rhizophila]|nr:hypothetical protein QJS66_12485 [Kocuria rhizophila]